MARIDDAAAAIALLDNQSTPVEVEASLVVAKAILAVADELKQTREAS